MRSLVLAAGVFLAASATAEASVLYTFEDISPYTGTTFSYTESGLTATFTSSLAGSNNQFVVTPYVSFIGAPLSGSNFLQDQAGVGNQNPSLIIQFSQALTSLSLDFVTNSPASALTLTAYSGGSLSGNSFTGGTSVGSDTETGTFLNPNYPGGSLSVTGSGDFTTVVISGPSPSLTFFGVDNISASPDGSIITQAITPEPSTLATALSGVLIVAGYAWRRGRLARG